MCWNLCRWDKTSAKLFYRNSDFYLKILNANLCKLLHWFIRLSLGMVFKYVFTDINKNPTSKSHITCLSDHCEIPSYEQPDTFLQSSAVQRILKENATLCKMVQVVYVCLTTNTVCMMFDREEEKMKCGMDLDKSYLHSPLKYSVNKQTCLALPLYVQSSSPGWRYSSH